MSDAGAEEPVPKLPRGRGLKFSGPELFRILMTLATLVAVILLAKPCGKSVSNFVMGYGSGSAAPTTKPGTVEPPPVDTNQYEQLRPGMSDEEIKAAIERSKARSAANAAGSGAANAAGSGAANAAGNGAAGGGAAGGGAAGSGAANAAGSGAAAVSPGAVPAGSGASVPSTAGVPASGPGSAR